MGGEGRAADAEDWIRGRRTLCKRAKARARGGEEEHAREIKPLGVGVGD